MAGVKTGSGAYDNTAGDVNGEYIQRDGANWYKINNYDQMDPFFVSLVNPTNFWMFISTTGGLTCGRENSKKPLFPYATVDKVTESYVHTGPKTIVRVKRGTEALWEPFVPQPRLWKTKRNVYKTETGNAMEFEEENLDLGVTFSYTWTTADDYGVVRTCKVVNNNTSSDVEIDILDGLMNIVPSGVDAYLQSNMSVLVDAYKRTELVKDSGLGIFCLYAKPWDRAEPKESLEANVVYSSGLPEPKYLLSMTQVDDFRAGKGCTEEPSSRGKRGCFFVNSKFTLSAAKPTQEWVFVAEVHRNHGHIAALTAKIASEGSDLQNNIAAAVEADRLALRKIIGCADGLQTTEDLDSTAHHFNNCLFNVMRGGIFNDSYNITKEDFAGFLAKWNKPIAESAKSFVDSLPEVIAHQDLVAKAEATGDMNLVRLCMESAPLTFSRRHGDPSRPWNIFDIQVKDRDGNKIINYQGNWRDIFQNWEALCLSYPLYYTSMIAKFVNASTIDGYNPYRVSRSGIDWEKIEPEDPWAYIGYWGDHQIIYLLKFFEWNQKYSPSSLVDNLTKDVYAYANVPYHIKPYADIVKDPKTTVDFEHKLNHKVEDLAKEMGSDGKLLLDGNKKVLLVNLAEKILVTMLAKLSNFVFEGGIWLNTQRPEWNDANNALVGNGISMVTLYNLRRMAVFMAANFPADAPVSFSEEVAEWFNGIFGTFKASGALLKGCTPQSRRTMLDSLGEVASKYRLKVYADGMSGKKTPIGTKTLIEFFNTITPFLDHTIKVNEKENGLYHAYNLLALSPGAAEVKYLYEMLEGQVNVLGCGLITGQKAVEMLECMYKSSIWRKDQNTFMLYPDRALPSFMDRNSVPADKAALPGMKYVLDKGLKAIAYKDCAGAVRFADTMSNAGDLAIELGKLAGAHPALAEHKQEFLDTYEGIFNHLAFTGRSGTMFSYEGLGCIYWQMCSKLLLSTQEVCIEANAKSDAASEALHALYYRVRSGLGTGKSPKVYGAFPADPYSHTPGHSGAQQPGLTGQVKEEVITRFGELGIAPANGKLSFKPFLLRKKEFLTKEAKLTYVALDGTWQTVPLKAGQLAFTYCQVPIVYTMGAASTAITVDGKTIAGCELSEDISKDLFSRSGKVKCIEVSFDSATKFVE